MNINPKWTWTYLEKKKKIIIMTSFNFFKRQALASKFCSDKLEI